MKKLFLLTPIALLACQAADNDVGAAIDYNEDTSATIDDTVQMDGIVRVILQDPVSEPRACIVPIRIENGLDGDVNVTMIGFGVTGPGEDTTGNMFAPVAESGTASEARVILEGQSCDAFDTLSVPEVLCKVDDADCSANVELEDGDALSFSQ